MKAFSLLLHTTVYKAWVRGEGDGVGKNPAPLSIPPLPTSPDHSPNLIILLGGMRMNSTGLRLQRSFLGQGQQAYHHKARPRSGWEVVL